MKYLKTTLWKYATEYYNKYHDHYGILGIGAAIAVFLKMLLFYGLIGTITNIIPVLMISYGFLFFLFSSIKNKWIPASIFAVFSILMVCDVTYASFFNRYLSVNVIGSAVFLKDVLASIKEVFRPSSLLLLVDVFLIFACLIRRRQLTGQEHIQKEGNPSDDEAFMIEEASILENPSTMEDTSILENISTMEDTSILENTSIMEETSMMEEVEPLDEIDRIEQEIFAMLDASVSASEEKKKVLPKRRKRNKKTFGKWFRAHGKPLTALIVLLLLLLNITGSSFVRSISNQEIITYHMKDFLTGALGISEGNNLVAFTDSYRGEKNGPLFGVAKDRNLIVIQMESFQNFVVGLTYNGQEVTPNLNRLLEENTAYFDNYYQQVGSGNTSDAEFATNNSIYGSLMSYTYKLYGSKNYFRGLPVLLGEQGYDTAVFHAYEDKKFWSRESAYPNLGFNAYYGGLTNREGDGAYEMKEWMGWGLTDTYFFEQTVDLMENLESPFYSFVISLSNHHPYLMLEPYRFIELLPEDEGTLVGNYLNSVAFTDHALGEFLDQLKERGMYDQSIIALYGDHVGLTHSEEIDESMERLLGKPYSFDTMMNIPLIITLPNASTDIRQTISTAGGQLDFLPTIAYLMGFETLSTIYLGHNLFTISEGLVAEQTYMTKGSYFKNDMAYEMARDGVFEHGRAWNLKTGEAIPLNQCYEDYVRSMDIVNTSEYVLRSDAIRKIYLEGQDAQVAFSQQIAKPHPDMIAIAGAPGNEYANSIEAIDYSYKYGNRQIRVSLHWTENSEPIGINQVTGKTEMTYGELIDWMERHADTNIIVNIQRSGDYFVRFMAERSPAVAERIVLELPELAEYTGKHDGIINLMNVSQSTEEIAEFIKRNRVWAILMTKEDAEGRFASLLESQTAVYVIGEVDGFITKAN